MIGITCRQAAELLSRSQHDGLEGLNRLALSVHLAICSNCRTYSRQLRWIDRALSQPPAAELGEAAHRRIAQVLDQARSSEGE